MLVSLSKEWRYRVVWLVIILIVALDQLTKYYISLNMFPETSLPVINGIFHITYVLNPGAAFGLFKYKTGFFLAIAVVLIALVAYLYPRLPKQRIYLRWGMTLMTSGAVGNVIDRLRTGYVVDFFDFRIWPVFNVADIAIVCGVALMTWDIWQSDRVKE